MSAHPVASTLRGFSQALSRTLVSEDAAHAGGVLQGIDPRAKLVGMLALVVSAALAHRVGTLLVLLAETANQMFESRQSRVVGSLKGSEQRHMMINTGGVLLSKTMALGDEVYMAMLARGFRGEVRLLTDFRMRSRDWLAVTLLMAAAAAAIVAGR